MLGRIAIPTTRGAILYGLHVIEDHVIEGLLRHVLGSLYFFARCCIRSLEQFWRSDSAQSFVRREAWSAMGGYLSASVILGERRHPNQITGRVFAS